MDLKNYFGRVYCVSLERRQDRWDDFLERFPGDWPFQPVQKVSAIDGAKCKPPGYWPVGGGAWGCYKTHLNIIEQCLNDGVDSVLLLEDDAVFADNFATDVKKYLKRIPKDWDMLYLGGQTLDVQKNPPIKINKWVYQPYNVNRTHAWAVRGAGMLKTYKYLSSLSPETAHHIDHYLGEMHKKREDKIYIPKRWLVGQAEGKSNISGNDDKERVWNHAENINKRFDNDACVAVLGVHSSGSSCCAGVLYHLGLHLGNQLVGYYGKDPSSNCGFEAAWLAKYLEKAVPLPETSWRCSDTDRDKFLERFFEEKRREASSKKVLAAIKHPLLCQSQESLFKSGGKKLKIVHINRPIEESIKSLQKREKNTDPKKIEKHQRWLLKGKNEIIAKAKHVLHIEYADLLSDPKKEIKRMVNFLDLKPSTIQMDKAINYVKPDMRHVKLDV